MQKLLLCLVLSGLSTTASTADLTAYAEESAPYHYTERGKVIGIAADFLRAACTRAALSCDLQILPWARAYALGSSTPDTLIYSTVRRPEREALFHWISPIINESLWLYGSDTAPAIKDLRALAGKRIGVINGSASIGQLKAAGLAEGNLELANSKESNFKKFAARRVDYIVETDVRFDYLQRQHALPFKPAKAKRLGDATSYYAMNLHSDPAKVSALRSALAALRADSTMERITQAYQLRLDASR